MLDSIESAIEDIKNGKLVIVVDDEDRENEGDFITASHNITPELINFMAKHGRGLICAPLEEDRCAELELDLMVNNNTALHETAFTVSVDLLGDGCTTGISAHDRAKTFQALVNPSYQTFRPGKTRTYISTPLQKKAACSEEQATRKPQQTSPVLPDFRLLMAVRWWRS